jgi:hypothetical protein
MSWVAVAAAAAVASTAITGYSAYTSNKTAEKQAEADANAQLARGRLEAERIRKEKDKAQSRARAAAAGNGLDVHEGTALVINDQIELDAIQVQMGWWMLEKQKLLHNSKLQLRVQHRQTLLVAGSD